MSDAHESDLLGYLSVRRAKLEEDLRKSRNKVLAEASQRGTLGAGSTHCNCIAGMEEVFNCYITEMADVVDRWSGENLPEECARKIVTGHIRQAVGEFATTETAVSATGRGIRGDALHAIEVKISESRKRIMMRVREFELGADRNRNVRPDSVVNIVHAQNIVGGVQQAGGDATQTNSINLSAEAIDTALNHLVAHLKGVAPEILRDVEHDVATIKSQLAKPSPNGTIVQESGRTIRTVVEGAIGGALGNALSPGVAQALTAFADAIGL